MTLWESVKFDYPDVPTMITAEERKYLYWLGSDYWKDGGHVVEIGPWLGGSTICLASGMRVNPQRSNFRLHVIDNFLWRAFMGHRKALPLNEGDSFQSYFERNVEDYLDLITVHRQTLPSESTPRDQLDANISLKEGEKVPILDWKINEPVEILFVDGAKSWSGFQFLLAQFCKHMEPGKSLIVCQDYKYWGTYWIALIIEYFIGHFKLEHNLGNNTVSFRLTSELSLDEIDRLGSVENFNLEAGLALLENASQRLLALEDRLGALILQSCKVRFCFHKQERSAALEMFRKLESEWPHRLSGESIDRMRQWLEEETNMAHKPSRSWILGGVIRRIGRYFPI